jgi:hypothetical protein
MSFRVGEIDNHPKIAADFVLDSSVVLHTN